jgi:hypothetical protein
MLGAGRVPYDHQVMREKVIENETNAHASVVSFCLTLPLPSLYKPARPVNCRQKDALQ